MGLTFYIGFMACGKSTLAKKHATESHRAFTDLDTAFFQETGTTPAAYIVENGEQAFRLQEKKVLRKVVEQWHAAGNPATIIACGGGTPCFFDNLAYMKQHGTVVFIDTPVPVLWERIEKEPDRWPLAQKDRLATLYKERRKWYEQAHKRLVPKQ